MFQAVIRRSRARDRSRQKCDERGKRLRNVRDNTENDEDRRPVPDSALGNLFAQPKHNHGPGCEDQRSHNREEGFVDDNHLTGKTLNAHGLTDRRRIAEHTDNDKRLQKRNGDRHVSGVLSNFLLSVLFIAKTRQTRHHRTHQLHDNGCTDVGHNTESKNSPFEHRPAGEHIIESDKTFSCLRETLNKIRQHRRIQARKRKISADTGNEQKPERDDNAIPEFRNLPAINERGKH